MHSQNCVGKQLHHREDIIMTAAVSALMPSLRTAIMGVSFHQQTIAHGLGLHMCSLVLRTNSIEGLV